MNENYVTDKQIKDEAFELASECQLFIDDLYRELDGKYAKSEEERGLWGRTLFIYLKDKVFYHPTKFQRNSQK